jgi:hypothetical protein
VRYLVRRVVVRHPSSLVIVATIALASAMSGCLGIGSDGARLHQQAQAALGRWADAVAAAGGPSPVVLVGERTAQVGDWELAVGDNNKRALYAGLVRAALSLPTERPPDGQVQWQGGARVTVPVISAQQAIAAIQAYTSGPCGDCTSLRVVAARLTVGPIETSRGRATGPIWEFTLDGTAVKLARVAVADPITVVPPLWDPNNAPIGLGIDSATGTIGGHELTVQFTGAPLPADQPCGEDYTTEAVESDLAVVVIVTRHPHFSPLGEACAAVGAPRTATVELAAPLGDRAVLEVQQGLPVPVVMNP